LGVLAPEPSLRHPFRFCAFAQGDSRFYGLLPLFVVLKKNMYNMLRGVLGK
jgi:hypothetical protein